MTEDEFAHAVRILCQQFGGSVTSWGRTDTHSRAVGGFPGDPHSHWFGADVVWDGAADQQRCTGRHVMATELELTLIHEGGHDHLQPMHYPGGPLSDAHVEAWKTSASAV